MRGLVQFFGPVDLRALTPADLRERGSSVQLYRLLADVTCVVPEVGRITVPEGFITDFASIPRVAWLWLSPEDPVVLFASIVHDWLYSVQGRYDRTKMPLTREKCDRVLQAAMLACLARRSQAWVVYQAVRLGGESHWQQESAA